MLPKLIDKYYADLADLARQNVFVEMGTRTAFFALLHAAGREHGWTLIAEQEKMVGGKTIRKGGTFKDEMNLVRGYWEAKDTADLKVVLPGPGRTAVEGTHSACNGDPPNDICRCTAQRRASLSYFERPPS